MRRIVRFVLRNWPLKLAAVLLASLLYSGLVLSQNVRTFTGPVPVDVQRPPAGAALLSEIEPLREVRFRAPFDVGIVSPDWFRATIDLANVQPRAGGEPQEVAVTVRAVDSRVVVVDFEPRTVQVRLDTVEERELPVTVERGTLPEGITIGPPQTEPSRVTVRGPGSRVATVRFVVARVVIDASGLNIDREVPLEPIDDQGNVVAGLEIAPARATVRIAVAEELASRTLPIVPQIVGELPAGYQLGPVSVQPLTVTVGGAEAVVAHMEMASTAPIDVTGRTRDFEIGVALDLPAEVSPVGSAQATVSLVIREESGTRSYLAGLNLVGTRAEYSYRPATTQVTITLGGPLSQLDSVDGASLRAQLQVTDLEPGLHVLPLTLNAPVGLQLLAIQPDEVIVRIEASADEVSMRPATAVRLLRA